MKKPPKTRTFRVEFVFYDWLNVGLPATFEEEMAAGVGMGCLHGGHVAHGTLELDADDAVDFARGVAAGLQPTFWVSSENVEDECTEPMEEHANLTCSGCQCALAPDTTYYSIPATANIQPSGPPVCRRCLNRLLIMRGQL